MIERILQFDELPHYFTIKAEFDQSKNLVTVYIESKVHVNKRIKMPNQWSIQFVNDRPNEFRGDILNFVIQRYGLKLEAQRYC